MRNNPGAGNKKCSVAIDGPAGSGKSTVARKLARRLGYTYIDSGAMYRTVAYRAIARGLDLIIEGDKIGDLAGELDFEFRLVRGEPHLFEGGEDVEWAIRSPEVGNLSSSVSTIPQVREYLVAAQRQMAKDSGVVMEGRDIGTVVLPEADVKIFLTASVQERARRRQQQLQEKGIHRDLAEIVQQQQQRDDRDSSRDLSPLRQAEDATKIISDGMSEDEVVDLLEKIVRQAEAAKE